MTRRDWFYLAGQSLLAQDSLPGRELQQRIAQTIRAYEQQGIHRTGTKVDQISANWLADEVRQSGLTPAHETFPITRVDPITASLSAAGRRQIEGVMLYDGGFTDATGVSGRLGPLLSDAPIGLTEIVPNTAGVGPLAEARRQDRHRAIVVVTRGGRPGLCPSNAESFLDPFGPPVLQVSSEEADALVDLATRWFGSDPDRPRETNAHGGVQRHREHPRHRSSPAPTGDHDSA
jgi:hypothetical protein